MSSTEKLQHDDDPESLFSVQVELKDPIPVVVPALQKDFDAGASSSLDPHQWSTWRKWTNVFIVAFQATLSPVCSTLVAVGSSDVDREFHVSNSSVSALPVALFVVGLGVGPLYLAPLSEMYGRRIVYIISLAMFCLFNLGGALVHNEVGFIILRLLAGLAGSAGPSLGGGTIGDMFSREERGGAQAVYAFGPTFGPAIGGLIGGYISQHAGWRWLPGIMAIS
ncbi:hypothetical protein EUX98_g2163 [Antrodiella citrinella]|uniref:Major facilitator superfamily (MFS) profile domain-containing protein n=1 Tax=Antrodiella citrinella TaxID=2447956 RepID=A0A4S4MZP5_9APHY|nr:hypothetical protein EUX98_g2163 [Antrodiella citrinella]